MSNLRDKLKGAGVVVMGMGVGKSTLAHTIIMEARLHEEKEYKEAIVSEAYIGNARANGITGCQIIALMAAGYSLVTACETGIKVFGQFAKATETLGSRLAEAIKTIDFPKVQDNKSLATYQGPMDSIYGNHGKYKSHKNKYGKRKR